MVDHKMTMSLDSLSQNNMTATDNNCGLIQPSPTSPSTPFSVTTHRKIVLSPMSSPMKPPTSDESSTYHTAATTPTGTTTMGRALGSMSAAALETAFADLPPSGTVLRKVASLTFKNHVKIPQSPSSTQLPKPNKLDITHLERFEGQFLLAYNS